MENEEFILSKQMKEWHALKLELSCNHILIQMFAIKLIV